MVLESDSIPKQQTERPLSPIEQKFGTPATEETGKEIAQLAAEYWSRVETAYRFVPDLTNLKIFLKTLSNELGQHFPFTADTENSSGVSTLPKQLVMRSELLSQGVPSEDPRVAKVIDCKLTTAVLAYVLEKIAAGFPVPPFQVSYWATAEENPSNHVNLMVKAGDDGYHVSYYLADKEKPRLQSTCEVRKVSEGEWNATLAGRLDLFPINWESLRSLDRKYLLYEEMMERINKEDAEEAASSQ